MKSRSRLISLLLVPLLYAVSGQAGAAGFYITEIGTPGSLGTAGAANVTNDFGADSALVNPAGMTGLDRDTLVGGLQVIAPKVEFDPSRADAGGDDGGNAGNAVVVPSLFYVKKVNPRLRLGFSTAVTQGGGVNYGNGFVGRYSATKAELGVIGLSPAIGYQVNDDLSIGAGVTALYTNFELNLAVNTAALIPGSPDAKVRLENLDDWAFQPYVGLTYRLTDRALLGAVYRAESDVNLEGDVNVRNWRIALPKPKFNDAEIDWDNPQWLDVGLRYQLTDRDTLFLNGGWQDWSAFSKNGVGITGGAVSVDTELDRQFDDTWYARIGYSHTLTPESFVAFGFSYDSSPVDDDDRTFDLPFDEYYKLSAAYGRTGREGLDYSIGATLMLIGDSEIEQTSQGVTAAGEFDTNIILFLGGTLRYEFQ